MLEKAGDDRLKTDFLRPCYQQIATSGLQRHTWNGRGSRDTNEAEQDLQIPARSPRAFPLKKNNFWTDYYISLKI